MTVRWIFEDYWRSQTHTQVFYWVGAPETFTVPAEVTMLYVSARGAAGGGTDDTGYHSGGYVAGHVVAVNEGDTFTVRVGEHGNASTSYHGAAATYNGGGAGGDATNPVHVGGTSGGGATDIRAGGDDLADRIIVAAGAGGMSGGGHAGGVGGASTGGDGAAVGDALIGGHGGTQLAGGTVGHNTSTALAHGATAGDLGVGGRGADNPDTDRDGAGGGGAGLYGGGGGGLDHPQGSSVHDYSGGGGGGSNSTAGFDITQLIRDEPGTFYQKSDDRPVSYAAFSWNLPGDSYTWEINPNSGGSPNVSKTMNIIQNVGPNRVNVIQEGGSTAAVLSFSGVILTQDHYEAIEAWFNKRILIKLTDDLGRQFYGSFSRFSPKRERRASNPWYHTYDADFTVTKYTNASGLDIYGRVS